VSMRTFLAVAATAVATLVPLGIAGPAHAESCAGPVLPHFGVDLMTVHGATCDHARDIAKHAIHSGAPHGWQCHQTDSGLIMHMKCHLVANPQHVVHFNYRAKF
jgi:hypothetical protein